MFGKQKKKRKICDSMKPNQKMYDEMGNQVLLYPSTLINITQSVNGQLSHMGVTSIDDNGGATNISQFYAPCDLKLVMIMDWAENPLIWQSINPVRLADNSVSHITIRNMHQDDISMFSVGDIYLQGQPWVEEGNAGFSTGNHVHLEVIKGHTTTLKLSPQGKYSLGLYGIDQNPDSYFHANDVTSINQVGVPLNFIEYTGETTSPGESVERNVSMLHAMVCKAFPFNF